MRLGGKRVLVCNCDETMAIDGQALAKACQAAGGEGEIALNSQLCRAQMENLQSALRDGEPLLVACTQEAPLFSEVAAEENPEAEIAFANIRENAGWSDEGPAATAKMAALIAEATEAIEPTPAVELSSEGVCLVYGKGEQAFEAAKRLAPRLEVTLLLSDDDGLLPPAVVEVPIFKGRISAAKGHMGGFGVTVQGYAPAKPSARGRLEFEPPRSEAFSQCDLILDLSGGTPLFPAHQRRDGYLRPDPGDPLAVERAIFEISDLLGEFEKPRYIRFDGDLCAHSRSRQTGCTRCLDVCPTSAIASAGDAVEIDPQICAGCGSCASVCPTGAATYQLPAGDSLLQRLRTLLTAYGAAGGDDALLVLHDTRHGAEMLGMMARLGRGLPARALPFPVNEVTQVGIDFLAAAQAYGAGQIAILIGPDREDELAGLAGQIGLAETVMEGLGYGGGRIHILDQRDPEAVEAALYGLAPQAPAPAASFLPMGGKRARTMLALRHLHSQAPEPLDILPLPAGAPFGTLSVDTGGCTLCLACVGACPTGALLDNPDKPYLGFREEACVQCGICRNSCPESVMTLEPRLNFTESAKEETTLNEAEPFECVRCGRPFGVKQSIERIVEKLAGKSAMFSSQEQIDRIRMCEDCRVIVQFEEKDAPMRTGDRPLPRTTDDDLREREIEEARAKLLAERAAQEKNGEAG